MPNRLEEQRLLYEDMLRRQQGAGGIHAATGATPEEVAATRMPEGNPANLGAPSMKPGDFFPSLPNPGPWFAENLPDTYRLLTGGSFKKDKPAPATPAPAAPPTMRDRPPPVDPGYTPTPPPAAETPAEPTTLDELMKRKALLDKLYPNLNFANPAQDKADARAETEKERTKLLAQLAVASGVTAMGGEDWQQMSKGFGIAASMYDEGFARYQKALQESADRYAEQQMKKAEFDTAKTDAAVSLYSKSQERSDAVQQNRLEIIQKHFDAEAKLLEGDELTGTDPEKIRDYMYRRGLGLQMGRYIPPTEEA